MHPELEILLQIQDLKSQRAELTQGDAAQVEQEQFRMDVGEAVDTLAQKIGEMEEELSPSVRGRYRRIAEGPGRAVAPAINGICYGCFVAIPTARWATVSQNQQLYTCENCGRFLYAVG